MANDFSVLVKRTGFGLPVFGLLLLIAIPAEAATSSHPVLRNMASLCTRQRACIARQEMAMRQALAFLTEKRLRPEKVALCNRNAARSRHRVDWIGFNNCIRNPKVRPPRSAKVRLW